MTGGETEAQRPRRGVPGSGRRPGPRGRAAPALWPHGPPVSDRRPPDGRSSPGCAARPEASSMSGTAPPWAPASAHGPDRSGVLKERVRRPSLSGGIVAPRALGSPGQGAGRGLWLSAGHSLRVVSLQTRVTVNAERPPGALRGWSEVITVKCLLGSVPCRARRSAVKVYGAMGPVSAQPPRGSSLQGKGKRSWCPVVR